jgi:hypothetical protein
MAKKYSAEGIRAESFLPDQSTAARHRGPSPWPAWSKNGAALNIQ